MMLQTRKQNLVAGFDVFATVSLRNQIETCSRATYEDNLGGRSCIDETPNLFPSYVARSGSTGTQQVNGTVYVGVVVGVIVDKCVNDRLGFLSCRSIVEINQRFAVDLLFEDRKILPDSLHV